MNTDLPFWREGAPDGALLRFHIRSVSQSMEGAGEWATLRMQARCFIQSPPSSAWIEDEDGLLVFDFREQMSFSAYGSYQPVGEYGNRWDQDDCGHDVSGDPKYEAVVGVRAAFPDADLRLLHARLKGSKAKVIEVVVADGSPGGPPPQGVMLGGRIYAVHLDVEESLR